MTYKRFSIGIDSELYRRLRELKRLSGEPISKLIESMIAKQIVKFEEHYRWIDEMNRRASKDLVTTTSNCKPVIRIKYKPDS